MCVYLVYNRGSWSGKECFFARSNHSFRVWPVLIFAHNFTFASFARTLTLTKTFFFYQRPQLRFFDHKLPTKTPVPTTPTANGPTATHNSHTTCTNSLQEVPTVSIPRKTTTLPITNAPVPGIQESFPSKPTSIDVRDVWSWPLKWLLPIANLPWNRPNMLRIE